MGWGGGTTRALCACKVVVLGCVPEKLSLARVLTCVKSYAHMRENVHLLYLCAERPRQGDCRQVWAASLSVRVSVLMRGPVCAEMSGEGVGV